MNHAKRTYVVTAANGRIGGRVARGLLQAGHTVRAIGRNPERLKLLADAGATTYQGDVRDAGFLEQAFRGADAAFLLVSASRTVRDFRRDFGDIGAHFASALRKTGVPSALFVSTIGAHDDRYRGFVLVHGDVERSLDAVSGLNVVHLRAPGFFENLLYWLPRSRTEKALSSPIASDAELDLAPTSDIAAVALSSLLELDVRGRRVVELQGREVLTIREIAKRIGERLGRSFPAVRTPRAEDLDAMIARGASRDFATLMNDTWDTFSTYGLELRAERADAVVKATTSIDEYIRNEFAPALEAPTR